MLGITCRNVNDVYPVGILYLREEGIERKSRNGPVLEYPEPVSIEYERPTERVLFDKQRAINPFLHFFEPLWILAAQKHVGFLADIVPRFKDYSDDGETLFGAYGARMKHQITEAVQCLRINPDDRRVVLMIREPSDVYYTGKDSPCNIAVALKVRDGRLNMHVFNRSNDYIWGMTGANMPQFSTLQEYLAGMIGVGVGTYHQTTDSMHVYTNEQWDKLKDATLHINCPYANGEISPYPIFYGVKFGKTPFDNPLTQDISRFFHGKERDEFKSPYFNEVVAPMWRAFEDHKLERTGLQHVPDIAAADWQRITREWLETRE